MVFYSASGQMLELFHELDVNGNHTPQPHSQPLSRSQSGNGGGMQDGQVGHGQELQVPEMHGHVQTQSELVFALRQNEVSCILFTVRC